MLYLYLLKEIDWGTEDVSYTETSFLFTMDTIKIIQGGKETITTKYDELQ